MRRVVSTDVAGGPSSCCLRLRAFTEHPQAFLPDQTPPGQGAPFQLPSLLCARCWAGSRGAGG